MKKVLILDFAGLGDSIILHNFLMQFEIKYPNIQYFICYSVLEGSTYVTNSSQLKNKIGTVPSNWGKYNISDYELIEKFLFKNRISSIYNLQADYEYIGAYSRFKDKLKYKYEFVSVCYDNEIVQEDRKPILYEFMKTFQENFDINSLKEPWIKVDQKVKDSFVGVFIGSYEPCKRWEIDKWKKVIDYLLMIGKKVNVYSGVSEDERNDSINLEKKMKLRSNLIFHRGMLIDEFILELAKNPLLISNDSGPAHLAAAMGLATVTLFWNSDAYRWAPQGRESASLFSRLSPDFSEVIRFLKKNNLKPRSEIIKISGLVVQSNIIPINSNKVEIQEEDFTRIFNKKECQFLISKNPISVKEYELFVQNTGYRTTSEVFGWSNCYIDGEWLKVEKISYLSIEDKDAPAFHISYADACAYCNYISEKIGKTCRLPRIAELDYASTIRSSVWSLADHIDEKITNETLFPNQNALYNQYEGNIFMSQLTPITNRNSNLCFHILIEL